MNQVPYKRQIISPYFVNRIPYIDERQLRCVTGQLRQPVFSDKQIGLLHFNPMSSASTGHVPDPLSSECCFIHSHQSAVQALQLESHPRLSESRVASSRKMVDPPSISLRAYSAYIKALKAQSKRHSLLLLLHHLFAQLYKFT